MAGPVIAKRFGPYVIKGKIGSGGMAKVYKAVDERSDRTVALKLLHATLSEESEIVQRFKAEAEIVKRLQHPAIVGIYDYGVVKGHPYLVMQYMARGSLSERFQQPGEMGSQEVVRLLRRIASALDHAHRHNIVHRDIKLENILLDERGEAWLSDFGIARVTDAQHLTQTGMIVGTPLYMSPEQAMGRPDVDYRADLYALGVVAYLLTVGRFPFGGDNVLAILNMHVMQPPPLPTEVMPDLPPSLDMVMMKALAKQPQDRYISADAFIEAYARAMSDHAPRRTIIDIRSDHAISKRLEDYLQDNAQVTTPPGVLVEDLVARAEDEADRDRAIELLKQAIEIDPWHNKANRLLHRLEEVKSLYERPVPAPDTEPEIRPLPDLERKLRPSIQDKRKERHRRWTRLGCLGGILLSMSCTLFTFSIIGVLPGFLSSMIVLLGGPTPVGAVNGVPIEDIPDAVLVVPPSQSKPIVNREMDILANGYNHEYTFDAAVGEEVAVYVQFLSVAANAVSANVAILAPNGQNYVDFCQRDRILQGGDSNVAFICPISISGVWKVRVLGRNEQSIGAYFVGVERLGF